MNLVTSNNFCKKLRSCGRNPCDSISLWDNRFLQMNEARIKLSGELSNSAGFYGQYHSPPTRQHYGGDGWTLADIRKRGGPFGKAERQNTHTGDYARAPARATCSDDAYAGPRQSARVRRVSQLLDCDESQVRRLVADGELEGHRVGKRGIRIFLASVLEYQQRQTMPRRLSPPQAVSRRKASSFAHRAAMAELRRDGIL